MQLPSPSSTSLMVLKNKVTEEPGSNGVSFTTSNSLQFGVGHSLLVIQQGGSRNFGGGRVTLNGPLEKINLSFINVWKFW